MAFDNFGARAAKSYTQSSLDRPWWDTAIGALPFIGDVWRGGKAVYDGLTGGMDDATSAASSIAGNAIDLANYTGQREVEAAQAAGKIAADKAVATAKPAAADPYNASWDAPGALEQYQSKFSRELHALPKFKRGTNFWDAANPLHQGMRNDAIAGTGTANANALDSLRQSLALRNVDVNDGIGAESERMFRLDNARQQGAQMSAIEQDRYKRFADFETDQDNLQREYDTKIAMAKDAQSRGDFTLASSLLTEAQQRASSALDMRQKAANLAEFQATSPDRISNAKSGYNYGTQQNDYGVRDLRRYDQIANTEFNNWRADQPMMRQIQQGAMRKNLGDMNFANAWGDTGRAVTLFGPTIASAVGTYGTGGLNQLGGFASRALSPGSFSRDTGPGIGDALPGSWDTPSAGPMSSLRRPMGTSGGGSFGGPRAFSSVTGHKPGMW